MASELRFSGVRQKDFVSLSIIPGRHGLAMELRHLRYFVAVSEAGSVTVAAERKLHTSQPSLSRQIRDLEAEIGAKLLTRSVHGVVLTQAGQVFLDHARLVLAQVETAREAARRAVSPDVRSLTLGFLSGEDIEWLPEAMRVLRAGFPGIEVKVVTGHSPDIAQAIAKRDIDLGFIRPERHAPDLDYKLLRKEKLLAIMPSDHRLQASRAVDLAEFGDDKFIGISETAPVLRPIIEDYVHGARSSLVPISEADYLSMAISLVSSTRGFALLPTVALPLLPWSVVSRPLRGIVPTIDLVMAYHKSNSSPPLRLLASKAEEMAARVSEKSLREQCV
jgi:LysR family hca operon transcriptional activator